MKSTDFRSLQLQGLRVHLIVNHKLIKVKEFVSGAEINETNVFVVEDAYVRLQAVIEQQRKFRVLNYFLNVQ